MMIRRFGLRLGLVSLFLSLVGATAPCWAAGAQDLYKITDIDVDVSAPTAAQARDKAILDAQQNGFDLLLARLDSPHAPKPDEATLARLVQGFEVQKEKSLSGRYIGTLTVQYKPASVRDYLTQKGAAFVEKQSQPFVVLPLVQKDAKKIILWEDRTPWRTAWEETARHGGVVPVIVPTGDLDDIKLIGAIEAVEGKSEAIQSVAQKYQGGGVIVAVLSEKTAPPPQSIVYHATLRLFDARGIAEVSDTITTDVTPPLTGKGMPAAMSELVKKARVELETTWKRATQRDAEPTTSLPSGGALETVTHVIVTVQAPDLDVWQAVRAKIDTVSVVTAQTIVSMTRGAVQVDLSFKGDVDGLRKALEAKGMALMQGAGGGWLLVL